LDKAKKLCSKLIANPFDCGLVFVGASGMGKTTIALAMADELAAELHHIPSQDCNIDTLKETRRKCEYVPMAGKRLHLVLVDEADRMSEAAQTACLSYLDGTNPAPNTVWIFTCNNSERFEPRFLSRNFIVEFSSYGIAKDAAALLERIWQDEAAPGAAAPNFARIVKESNNNVRASLMELQKELMFA
jgi:replication-associated recombination protein RarA